MKKKNAILPVALVVLLLGLPLVFILWFTIRTHTATHFMSQDVKIVEKVQTGEGYTITIGQNRNGEYPAGYQLTCTREQFDSVEVGDLVRCEWRVKGQRETGTVVELETSWSGKVTLLDKWTDENGMFLLVDFAGGPLTLSCEEWNYTTVEAGDEFACYWQVNLDTGTGFVEWVTDVYEETE